MSDSERLIGGAALQRRRLLAIQFIKTPFCEGVSDGDSDFKPPRVHDAGRLIRRLGAWPVHVQILATCAAGTPGEAVRQWTAPRRHGAHAEKAAAAHAPPPSWPQGGAKASEHAAPRMPAAHQRRRTACIGQQHIGVHVRAPGDPGYPQAAAPQHIRPKLATSIVRYQEARG